MKLLSKNIFIIGFIMTSLGLKSQNLIPYNNNGKIGLCDIDGKILLDPIYDNVNFYSTKTKGYSVQKDGKYGLFNVDLKLVIPFISVKPIVENNNGYIIYPSVKEIHQYSNTYQFIKSLGLPKAAQNSRLYSISPSENNAEPQLYNNDDVLQLFRQKYAKKQQKYHVVEANNTYFDISENLESGKYVNVGLFLPKIKTFFINTPEEIYKTATWNPSTSQYYILVKNGNNQSVIDQNKTIIFPSKEYSGLFVNQSYIGYKDKNDTSTKSVTHYFIINSGKTIKNQFSSFDPIKTLTIDGKNFDIFLATINNYKTHQSESVYIGENGKQYFSVDFELDD